MTQLRRDQQAISNFFDRVLKGIGHRGSSFTDVDALTHDEATDRFLFQEFKNADEQLNRGQARLLKGLARREFCTVWCVRRLDDRHVEWCDVATAWNSDARRVSRQVSRVVVKQAGAKCLSKT